MAGSESVAHELLEAAKDDFLAVRNMFDPVQFPERVFGLHAQQAVEKCLKAWLNHLEETHPYTHDLSQLLERLERRGIDIEPYWDFVELSAYAMQFRYEQPPTDEEGLNREQLAADIAALVQRVEEQLYKKS